MKKHLLSIIIVLLSTTSFAQSTYSRYDINRDGVVTIEDMTLLTNALLGKTNYPVTSITLSKSEASLLVGQTLSLTTTVLPEDADNKTLTWSSSDETVATVTDGFVTTIGEGTTEITATANDGCGMSASCIVSVVFDPYNGHEYVDLGLSVKWATCNVGASSPEEYGDFFAWGETTGYNSGKTSFSWSNYSLCKYPDTMKKYCLNSEYGSIDDKAVLESSDDAASVNWGNVWRIPTDAELTELRTKCTWTWTTQNDVNGYKVIGSNGNSIFLPAAGYFGNYGHSKDGTGGYYWSSSLDTNKCCYAYELDFSSNIVERSFDDRWFGASVRAVCP